jgi:acyl-CoA thioester hydrolase
VETPIVHTHQIRVRYCETDQMGVVYHANYLNWFEVGRTEFFRRDGHSYRELEKKGVLLPVVEASISFKQPALYDDVVEIRTHIAELSPVRLTFGYELIRVADGAQLVTGKTVHVFTNDSLKPIRLSRVEPDVYAWLEAQHKAPCGDLGVASLGSSSAQNRHDEGRE